MRENAFQRKLYEKILNADRIGAAELLQESAEEMGYEDTLKTILEPTLKEIGKKWKMELSLAHGYVAGKIAEDFLLKANLSKDLSNTPKKKGTIVLGNIEDDYHALGRRMLKTFLTSANWEVYDLGNDILASEFVDKAIEIDAQIIGASAMMYSTALNILKLRKEIDERGCKDKMLLAVGGAIFNLRPELVFELGGDISAKNAMEADAVLTEALKGFLGKEDVSNE